MGRHAIYKESISSKISGAVSDAISAPFRSRLVKSVFAARLHKSLTGFVMVAGFTAVTIVDPYSGTMASAETMAFYQTEDLVEEQIYGWESTQTISYSRGGFKIVTGQDAAALFVEVAAVPSPGSNKALGYRMVADFGWGIDQYSCLAKLWDRESNWRVNAMNKSSGAYGIPQSLPGTKMASEGQDWLTNPETQIRWGIKYIKGRYGTPCGALAHSNKYNWY